VKTYRIGLLNGTSFVFFGTEAQVQVMFDHPEINWFQEV